MLFNLIAIPPGLLQDIPLTGVHADSQGAKVGCFQGTGKRLQMLDLAEPRPRVKCQPLQARVDAAPMPLK